MSRLNWSDPAAVRRLVVDLRVAVDDADAVVADMLRPLRKRELGHVLHRDRYHEAHGKIVSMLAYAMPEETPSEGGDDGGNAPTH